MMIQPDTLLRAKEIDAYEGLPVERHREIICLILAEASLLVDKYRYVRRHDVPHIRELCGLIDLLWQEVEMESARLPEGNPLEEVGSY